MEILDLRHFSSVDLRSLLEDETSVVALAILGLLRFGGDDSAVRRCEDSARLRSGGPRTRFWLFLLRLRGQQGRDWRLYVTNGNRLPDARKLRSELLTHVIETLQQSPGIHRVEAQLLAHEANAVSRPFLETGFQRHPRLFMVLTLREIGAGAKLAVHPEVEIRPWTESDYQPSAAVITASYRGHVDAQINDQYHTFSGSLRFLNNIVRFPGCGVFDAEVFFRGARSQVEERDRT